MKRVLTAAVLIPIVIVALFRAPLWLFTLLVLGVALLAAKEYFDIAEKTGFRPVRDWSYVFLCLLFIAPWTLAANANSGYFGSIPIVATAIGSGTLVLLSPYLLIVFSMRREPLSQSLGSAAVSFLVLPYIGLPLVVLLLPRASPLGALYLLITMLLVWCGDIAAYYLGRAIGKHKLAPRISPGKTWEGSIASVVGAVTVGVLLFHYINPIADAFRSVYLLSPPHKPLDHPLPRFQMELAPLWFVALFAVCVNVAAQVGDLVESALKRGAGMKDSGTLLPGHGGVLDRIDALLFALPVGLLFYAFGMSRYFEQGVAR